MQTQTARDEICKHAGMLNKLPLAVTEVVERPALAVMIPVAVMEVVFSAFVRRKEQDTSAPTENRKPTDKQTDRETDTYS